MRSLVLSLTLAAALVVPVSAQQTFTVSGRAATVTVGGRFHYQYAYSSMDAAANDLREEPGDQP